MGTQSVEYGEKLSSVPAVSQKAGYGLVGWYTDKDCTEEYDFSKAVTGRMTLYAKWETLTEIKEVNADVDDDDTGWYTIRGIKLDKKPTETGVYIHNGRAVMVVEN